MTATTPYPTPVSDTNPRPAGKFVEGGLAAVAVAGIVYLFCLTGLRVFVTVMCAGVCSDTFGAGSENLTVAGVTGCATAGLLVVAQSRGSASAAHWIIVVLASVAVLVSVATSF